MERSLELAIHERLAEYLAYVTTIDDFKSWLVASTWTLDQTQPSPGVRLANEIKLAFAEHSSGFRSDEELRDGLVGILNRIEVEAVIRDQGIRYIEQHRVGILGTHDEGMVEPKLTFR